MQPIERTSDSPGTIVLIHGLWMSPKSWEHWIDRYTRAGYTVLAPPWPGMDRAVAQLRTDTRPFERIGIRDILDHYVRILDGLPTSPIIMGHSFGGTFTEVLIDRGFGAAGVAIDPAAVKGVLRVPFSTLRSEWPVQSTGPPELHGSSRNLHRDWLAVRAGFTVHWSSEPVEGSKGKCSVGQNSICCANEFCWQADTG